MEAIRQPAVRETLQKHGMTPNARASLGIGRTFQNLALFHHMSVLGHDPVGSGMSNTCLDDTPTSSASSSRPSQPRHRSS